MKVDTTTEFPLDVVCTLMFSSKDMEEYEALDKRQKEEEARVKKLEEEELNKDEKEHHIIMAPLEERVNEEV